MNLDGYVIAIVTTARPHRRSYYCECWSQAPVWIPYRTDDRGNWTKCDPYPPRLGPTLYTLDVAARVLVELRAKHTEHFGALMRIIDARTGEVVTAEAVAA